MGKSIVVEADFSAEKIAWATILIAQSDETSVRIVTEHIERLVTTFKSLPSAIMDEFGVMKYISDEMNGYSTISYTIDKRFIHLFVDDHGSGIRIQYANTPVMIVSISPFLF